jgi:hypothetical protein
MKFVRRLAASLVATAPSAAVAGVSTQPAQATVSTGISAIWILANISYAGMRAQNSASSGWRIVAFIFGLPGTLVSFLAIGEGSERAYGIEVPRRGPRDAE